MDWWVWCLEKQLIICSSCYCQRCKFPLLFSYYVPRCVSHLNYSCLSMQTSANSAIITLIFLLRTEIQKTSRQTRDFVVFFPTWQTCGERPVCTRWWLNSGLRTKMSEKLAAQHWKIRCVHSFIRYKNQLTAECLLSDSCILSNCITIVDALSGNSILQRLIVELILVALDVAT